jgi:hypothetical protein
MDEIKLIKQFKKFILFILIQRDGGFWPCEISATGKEWGIPYSNQGAKSSKRTMDAWEIRRSKLTITTSSS